MNILLLDLFRTFKEDDVGKFYSFTDDLQYYRNKY